MIRGSCLCDTVAFEIAGEPSPIQLCHAARCRKATGSATSPELVAAAAGLRWIRGEDVLTVYEAPILHEPPAYRRAFCRRCGSPMPIVMEGTPLVIFQAGVLDGDPAVRPFRHAFIEQRAEWHEVTDDLPRFEGVPPGPDAADLERIAGITES